VLYSQLSPAHHQTHPPSCRDLFMTYGLYGDFHSAPPLLAHFPCLKKRKWCEISVMALCVLVCVTCHLKQMTIFNKIWYEYYIVWNLPIAIFIIVLQYIITIQTYGLVRWKFWCKLCMFCFGKKQTSTFAKI